MIGIEINPETSFHQLQTLFSKEFPFLKLAFFKKPHLLKFGSPKREMIEDMHTKVGSLSSTAMDLVLIVHPNMPVGEFEKLLEKTLHLHVQIFSRSGDVWLESIASDGLSLQRLNDRGKERNKGFAEKEEIADYHEQE